MVDISWEDFVFWVLEVDYIICLVEGNINIFKLLCFVLLKSLLCWMVVCFCVNGF